MPRKAKEKEELNETEKNKKNTAKRPTTKKASTSSSKSTTKKVTSKTETTKSARSTKKATKKATEKKSTTKATKKVSSSTKKKTSTEYYDLPQRYNQTVVKVLAQTPKTLFIYWEISDDDINKYKENYGENFFEITKPVLIIYNDTLNYNFEVEINDFANSWYLHVNDSKCDYRIELGRRPIQKNDTIKLDYFYITSSNKIESPNDHILFNTSQKMVYFRNVKTNQEFSKEFSTISFIRNMGKIYDIYDLYKELYKNEDDIKVLSNPSSHI